MLPLRESRAPMRNFSIRTMITIEFTVLRLRLKLTSICIVLGIIVVYQRCCVMQSGQNGTLTDSMYHRTVNEDGFTKFIQHAHQL